MRNKFENNLDFSREVNPEEKKEQTSKKEEENENKAEEREILEEKKEILREAEDKTIKIFTEANSEVINIEKGKPEKVIEKAREKTLLEAKVGFIKEKIKFALKELGVRLFKDAPAEEIDFSFSPELAAAKIWELPKEERKEMIKKIRREGYKQNKKIAEIESYLVGKIEEGVDNEELLNEVQKIGRENKFSLEQFSIMSDAVSRAITRKRRIRYLKEEYQTPENLYKAAFGREPKGKVRLEESNIGIMFIISDPDDYENAYLRDENEKNINNELIEKIKRTRGAVSPRTIFDNGVYIRYGVAIIKDYLDREKTIVHEKEHIIQHLFEKNDHSNNEFAGMINDMTNPEKKSEEEVAKEVMERISKKWLSELLNAVPQREFLAFFKSGVPAIDIYNIILNNYDTFSENQKKQEELLTNIVGDGFSKEAAEIIEKRRREYHNYIAGGNGCFKDTRINRNSA